MCLCLSVYVPTTLGLHNHLKKGITCNSSTASYLHLSYYFQFPYNWRTELQSPYRVHQYHSERRKACWVQIKKINIFLHENCVIILGLNIQQAKLGQNKFTHFQCRKVCLIKVITIQPLLLLHNIWVPFTFFMCHLSNWELKLFVHQENCNTYSGTNIINVCWTLAVAEPKTSARKYCEAQARIGKGWQSRRKASKLKPSPRAYTKVGCHHIANCSMHIANCSTHPKV